MPFALSFRKMQKQKALRAEERQHEVLGCKMAESSGKKGKQTNRHRRGYSEEYAIISDSNN
jgi:hypothetical protein